MEFSEKKAKEIIATYNLSEKTLRVWKSRNKIPDKYFDDKFSPRKKINAKAEMLRHNRLLDVLSEKAVNQKVIAELANVENHKIIDARRTGRKQVSLSERDYIALKGEINTLKIEIVETFAAYAPLKLRKLVNNPAIKPNVIIPDSRDNIRVWKSGKRDIEREEFERVKDYFTIFALKLKI